MKKANARTKEELVRAARMHCGSFELKYARGSGVQTRQTGEWLLLINLTRGWIHNKADSRLLCWLFDCFSKNMNKLNRSISPSYCYPAESQWLMAHVISRSACDVCAQGEFRDTSSNDDPTLQQFCNYLTTFFLNHQFTLTKF